jgi:hypothetical protein
MDDQVAIELRSRLCSGGHLDSNESSVSLMLLERPTRICDARMLNKSLLRSISVHAMLEKAMKLTDLGKYVVVGRKMTKLLDDESSNAEQSRKQEISKYKLRTRSRNDYTACVYK